MWVRSAVRLKLTLWGFLETCKGRECGRDLSEGRILGPLLSLLSREALGVWRAVPCPAARLASQESVLWAHGDLRGPHASPCLRSRYNGCTREAYFSVGLQGVAEEDVGAVRDLVDRTLDGVIECVSSSGLPVLRPGVGIPLAALGRAQRVRPRGLLE